MWGLGQQLRFLFMHIDNYTIGGRNECDQISNIYQYIIHRYQLDGKYWKKGELGENIDYSIISNDWLMFGD